MIVNQETTTQEACCHSHEIMDVAAAVANEPGRERELRADLDHAEQRAEQAEAQAERIVVCGKGPPHYFVQQDVDAPVKERICPWCLRENAEERVKVLADRLEHVSSVVRDIAHHQYDSCEHCSGSPALVAEARAALKGAP